MAGNLTGNLPGTIWPSTRVGKKKEKRTKQHEYCIQLSSSCSSCTLRNALISALSPISAPPETLCFGPPLLLVLCVKQRNHWEVSGGRSPAETRRYEQNKSGVKNSSGTLFSTPTWGLTKNPRRAGEEISNGAVRPTDRRAESHQKEPSGNFPIISRPCRREAETSQTCSRRPWRDALLAIS